MMKHDIDAILIQAATRSDHGWQTMADELEIIKADLLKLRSDCKRLCELNPAKRERYQDQLEEAERAIDNRIDAVINPD